MAYFILYEKLVNEWEKICLIILPYNKNLLLWFAKRKKLNFLWLLENIL